jgi:hypothetical protein
MHVALGWPKWLMVVYLAFTLCVSAALSNLAFPVHNAAGAASRWALTGRMLAARTGQTATLLPNGEVLVAGGIAPDTHVLDTAELYDPATGAWTATGSMTTPRADHTATLLTSGPLAGQVLLVGGRTNGGIYLASAELYKPATGMFTPTGNMAVPRADHTATLLPNGEVLVAGGYHAASSGLSFEGNSLAGAELYDARTGVWTRTAAMAVPRDSHTATLLPSGKVLVAGGETKRISTAAGFTDHFESLASTEMYDPATGRWTMAASMTIDRTSHAAALLDDGRVLVAGGRTIHYTIDSTTLAGGDHALATAELYDPARNAWTATTAMLTSRGGLQGTLVAGHLATATSLTTGQVLVIGGCSCADAELYDPATAEWTAAAALATGRTDQTATLLSSGGVLVTGGCFCATAEVYLSQR